MATHVVSIGSPALAPDELKSPQFKIDLLTQAVMPKGYRTPFQHTSIRVTLFVRGQELVTHIDGVPVDGYLTAVVADRPWYGYTPQHVLWSTGFSTRHAGAYRGMLEAARSFPARRFGYWLLIRNSNSLTRALLRALATQAVRLSRHRNMQIALNPLIPGWLWPLRW